MSVFLHMVLVVQGMWMPSVPSESNVSSRVDCVSRCYRKVTCSSVFYDPANGTCSLADTVFVTSSLFQASPTMQYLVWNPEHLGNCRDDYTLERDLNLCYRVYNTAMRWNESEDQCVQDGGHLLKVNTPGINDFVNQFEGTIWIGGYKDVYGRWIWSDNSPVEDTYWFPGQGESHNQDCMVVGRDDVLLKWRDAQCIKEFEFICQAVVNIC